MEQKEFNLLEEPWILAADIKGNIAPYSLVDIFAKAHNLSALSGELPTQDVAILRLLLGVLYAIYTRTEEYCNARDADMYDQDCVVNIWKTLWNKGCFNEDEIKEYLNKYHDRFWLVHPDRPFWQVNFSNAKSPSYKATEYSAAKLIGDLSESANKTRLFQSRSKDVKKAISYSEAARWLVHINAFDVSPVGSPGKNKTVKGFKVPWPATLGLIWIVGNTLFETLMLNLVLENSQKLWDDSVAWWEKEPPCVRYTDLERIELAMPDGITELMSMQYRYMRLITGNDTVLGFELWSGAYLNSENMLIEKMTTWKADASGNIVPRPQEQAKQMWRDFTALLPYVAEENKGVILPRPGVLEWVSILKDKDVTLPFIRLNVAGVRYGDKKATVEDVFSDNLGLNANLLSKLGDIWIPRITKDLAITDKMVSFLGFLAADIAMAAGDTDGKSKKDAAIEEGYFRLDMPFRNWLAGIDPQTQDMEDTCKVWIHNARDIIFDFGKQMVSQSGIIAFAGREVGQEQRKTRYTAPEAHLKFKGRINSLLRKEGYS